MKLLKSLSAATAILALTGVAQAALEARPGGMVYDTTLKITWLQNWNTNGPMKWTAANSWADNLVYGGFDDWRLPTSLNADGTGPCGQAFDCSGSELGHMFYNNWGASAGQAFSTGTNAANRALFTNVRSDAYWSGTEYALDPTIAWNFSALDGFQGVDGKSDVLYAVAVRSGDVASAVPEPQTYIMLLAGLGAVLLAVRRRPV